LNVLKDIYEYDTSLYNIHSSGFYISKSGDVFQKNMLAWDDETGVWTRHHWLDSLMDLNDSNTKALKDVIDLDTYNSDSLSFFDKDKNHVYFINAISDGIFRYIVKHADPKTFIGMKGRWGKDKSHVFYATKIVKQADVNSFQVYHNSDTASDKKYIYYLGKIIKYQ